MITWGNYEEYMMMHADGELTPTEEQALMAFVNEHPELKKELAAYTMTKLVPDATVVFENKQSLIKTEEKKRVIAFPVWQRYSIAAGIAALLFITLFKSSKPGNEVAIVQPGVIKTIVTDTQAHNPQRQSNDIVVAAPHVTIQAYGKTNDIAAITPVKSSAAKQNIAKHDDAQRTQMPVASVNTQELINKINLGDIKTLPYNSVAAAAPVVAEVPALPAATGADDEQERSFLDKLPLDDIKKQNMQHMATAFADGIDRVKTIRQGIDETSITVKIEKRKLIVSF